MIALTVYGGAAGDFPAGEIGGNKILVELDDRSHFLDFGTRFSVAGKYFAEFLKPRSATGLRDFLRMGLLPPLEGIYREDLAAHEPGLWGRYRGHPPLPAAPDDQSRTHRPRTQLAAQLVRGTLAAEDRAGGLRRSADVGLT